MLFVIFSSTQDRFRKKLAWHCMPKNIWMISIETICNEYIFKVRIRRWNHQVQKSKKMICLSQLYLPDTNNLEANILRCESLLSWLVVVFWIGFCGGFGRFSKSLTRTLKDSHHPSNTPLLVWGGESISQGRNLQWEMLIVHKLFDTRRNKSFEMKFIFLLDLTGIFSYVPHKIWSMYFFRWRLWLLNKDIFLCSCKI